MTTTNPTAKSAKEILRQQAIDRLMARGTPEGPIAELLAEVERAIALLSSRESPRYDTALLAGVHEANLRENADLPGIDEVAAAGLDPLFAIHSPFPRLRIQTGKLRAVIFFHKGVWHYLATGTAANSKDGSTNEYAEVMCDLLEAVSPKILAAVSIARLLRSNRVAAMIQASIEDRVDVVKLGAVTLDLRNEMTSVIWATYAAMATVERNLIVQRLAIGRINRWSRGEWFFGEQTIPPGYTMDKDKRLVVDESQVELVEGIIGVLASPTLSAGVAAYELGLLGLKTRDLMAPGRSFAETRHPSSAVPNLRRWLDLWTSGEHTVKMAVPFPNITTFGGQPVHYEPGESFGHVELPYSPGLPAGGWADPGLLALAAQNREESPPKGRYTSPPKGRAAAKTRRILSGLEVVDTDGTTILRVRHRGHDLVEIVSPEHDFGEGD